MKYFIGIDGGGTKTQFLLCDELGHIQANYTTSGSSYKEIGNKAVCNLIINGIEYVCAEIDKSNIAGICFGMPCYGENNSCDSLLTKTIAKEVFPLPIHIENDVYAAWAGALAFQSGIVVLAGTGSMAVGRNSNGVFARSGGWSEFFSDEGSCYWLGKKTLELFSKQSDNRLSKGKLYDLVRIHFSLKTDFELNEIIKAKYQISRKNVASLQFLLEEAALDGDIDARNLYKLAAEELVMMINAIKKTLNFQSSTPVSYSGSLFKATDLILDPFREALSNLEVELHKPLLIPAEGALLIAVDHFDSNCLQQVKEGLLKKSIDTTS